MKIPIASSLGLFAALCLSAQIPVTGSPSNAAMLSFSDKLRIVRAAVLPPPLAKVSGGAKLAQWFNWGNCWVSGYFRKC